MCYNFIAYRFSGKSSRHPCITKGESRPMSERLVGILVDSFGKILLPGLTVTIPLTAISVSYTHLAEVKIDRTHNGFRAVGYALLRVDEPGRVLINADANE